MLGFIFINYWNKSPRGKVIFLFLAFIPLFLLSGLRGATVGTDTENYLRGFKNLSMTSFNQLSETERWEIGYLLLNKLTSIFSSNEQAIILVTSFIFVFLTFLYIYKNTSNLVLSVYLFITLYLYLFSFNVIRQSIAMVIIAFGIQYIIKRRIYKYFIIVLLATLFHESAIIFICLYFVYGLRLNAKNLFYIFAAYFFIILSIDNLIKYFVDNSNSLSYLSSSSSLEEGSGFLFPLINMTILFFVSFIKITNKTNNHFDFYFLIVMLGFLTSILSIEVGILIRLNYYFFFLYIIILPIALNQISEKRIRFLATYIVVSVSLIYFIIRLTEGWHGIYPYEIF